MWSFFFFILSLLTSVNSFKTFKNIGTLRTYRQAKIVEDAEEYQIVTLDGNDYNGDLKLRTDAGVRIDMSPALVLNADYTPLSYLPLSLWCWQSTLRAVFNGKAVVVSEYSDLVVRTVSCAFPLPSVIALTSYQKAPSFRIPLYSRRNVYIRDLFKCQYCNGQFGVKDLSLDHVTPRSMGGKLTWSNTVTACLCCNNKKGQMDVKDLAKIGMKLRMLPRVPSQKELQSKSKIFKKTLLHPHWTIYV
mmetsp:Transcript_3277/g.3438  ORF Transcript_3277/g.3438 Transcript_3277/m.3438 type:complete len:246 (+) Transcript_3277:66-803(+)